MAAAAAGKARHSVRAANHADTAQVQTVFDIHGAHGVTRPSSAGIHRIQLKQPRPNCR